MPPDGPSWGAADASLAGVALSRWAIRMVHMLPHIDKFMPFWMCFGLVLAAIGALVAVLIVVATTSRRRDQEAG